MVEGPQTEDDPQPELRGMTILRVVEPSPIGHTSDASEEKLDGSAQAVSCAPVGCGTDSSMALQVPCCSGTLKASNYIGLLQLACALLWFRRQWRLAILR